MQIDKLNFIADPHFTGMDSFIIFFGVVEDRDDPMRLGRVRIRVIGTHPDDKELVKTTDLPWAWPVIPALNSAGTNDTGSSPVGPAAGTHLVGFFADGMDRQIPMFFGSVAGGDGQFKGGDQCNPFSGFFDPNAINTSAKQNSIAPQKTDTTPVSNDPVKPSSGSSVDPRTVLIFTERTGDYNHFLKIVPEFQKAVVQAGQDYLKATGRKLIVNSSFRSREEQQSLYNDLKGKQTVAKPGTSPHERGIGIDFQQYDKTAVDICAKHGIKYIGYKLQKDPWHYNWTGAGTPITPEGGTDPNSGDSAPYSPNCSTVGNSDQDPSKNVDPNYANAPTNLNGTVTTKGVESAKIFMQIAKRAGGLDHFEDYHVAAIMGNIAVESGFRAIFNGNRKTDVDEPPKVGVTQRPYGGSGAYGFAQWIGSRRDNFINYCNTNKVDPRTPTANIGFIVQELKTSYKQIINAVNKGGMHTASDKAMSGPWNVSDPDGKGFTAYWCGEFERPGADGPKSLSQRQGYTAGILAGLRNTNVPQRGAGK